MLKKYEVLQNIQDPKNENRISYVGEIVEFEEERANRIIKSNPNLISPLDEDGEGSASTDQSETGEDNTGSDEGEGSQTETGEGDTEQKEEKAPGAVTKEEKTKGGKSKDKKDL